MTKSERIYLWGGHLRALAVDSQLRSLYGTDSSTKVRDSEHMGGFCWMAGCGCLFWSVVATVFAWMV